MPRSRTEAMISGSCVLTTPHQDADKFIVDGKNGFIIPRNPVAVADKVEYLLNHYDEAVRIGQEGRKTALDVFSMDKYQENWKKLLEKATGKKL
jgi:glycosyltransferase involved in cell wall biosynthesis